MIHDANRNERITYGALISRILRGNKKIPSDVELLLICIVAEMDLLDKCVPDAAILEQMTRVAGEKQQEINNAGKETAAAVESQTPTG